MNNKILRTTIVLVIIIFNFFDFAFSQDFEPQHRILETSVEKSMSNLLDSIPDELLANYGINNRSELRKATIGNPIAVYTIVGDSIIFTNIWRVPLIIDNDYKSLFTVFKDSKNEYIVVDFGAKLLAREISKIENKDYLTGILRVYELRKDFLIFGNLQSDCEMIAIPNTEQQKYNLSDIMNMIR